MAKAKISKLIQALQGEIDGLVFRQMPDGSIVVSRERAGKGRCGQEQRQLVEVCDPDKG